MDLHDVLAGLEVFGWKKSVSRPRAIFRFAEGERGMDWIDSVVPGRWEYRGSWVGKNPLLGDVAEYRSGTLEEVFAHLVAKYAEAA
jgi:hypothetical protein